MNIAFCYEYVLPARGGCETYISDLARRLVADGHEVHLYARRWDPDSLPKEMIYHHLSPHGGPRFLRPWRFASLCMEALQTAQHDVTIGFDKTWGQDVLYPQGGLHVAAAEHNIRKHSNPLTRLAARCLKMVDPAYWSFAMLERRQYLDSARPLVVVNSNMVAGHFKDHYGVESDELRVVRSAIDPSRFQEHDRPRRRLECRHQHGIEPNEGVALFVAMNYRLKGLEPLLKSLPLVPRDRAFRLIVVGNRHIKAYEKMAKKLGVADRVIFVGPSREVHNYFFAADFLIHPTFYDPCSLVVLEALACGLPVITSGYNGAGELLHPPHEGYIVKDPHDRVRMAWAIRQLLDAGRRAECSQAARRAAAKWTFDHHYRDLLAVFREAAARKKVAA